MWVLINDEKGLKYCITWGKQHVVSRKDGDLLLIGDQSISRKHAQLTVDDRDVEEGVIIKDLQSKYGTFVKKKCITISMIGQPKEFKQLNPNEEVTLEDGDHVRFGIQWNDWILEYAPLLVATSTLTPQEKADVKQKMKVLGGQLASDWQDTCTHLTMNKLTITVKVVCALAAAQPIVTPAFWVKMAQSSAQSGLPDCKDYLPPLAEAMLNPSEVSFSPNRARSRLFNGFNVVASTAKQLLRIKPMITAAGGQVVEFSANTWTENRFLEEKNVLMLHSANERQTSQNSQIPDGYLQLARKLKSQGVRCIPESEIGLSVVYCNVAQYCNPRYSAHNLLGSSVSSLEATQRIPIICPDTQDSALKPGNHNVNAAVDVPNNQSLKQQANENQCAKNQGERKKTTTHTGSKDIFDSQNVNDLQPSKNKDQSLNVTNLISPNTRPITRKTVTVDPSLDMFAPSGSGNKTLESHNRSEVKPSCEDIFGSSTNKENQKQKIDNNDNFAGPCNMNEDDEFSFAPCTKKNKRQKLLKDDNSADELSFVTSKKTKMFEQKVDEINDEFSFTSNRKVKNALLRAANEDDDEFSFPSKSRPNKRCRLSNADIFASSVESSVCNIVSSDGPLKKTDHDESNICEKQDNVFNFSVSHKAKKKRVTGNLIDLQDGKTDLKLALFSRVEDSTMNDDRNAENELNQIAAPADSKNLITYSKLLPRPHAVKEEIEDEMDELAKELYNSTIVVVKPLIVLKEKPTKCVPSSSSSGGKNFKKFHKVVGLNKRTVPHIIGGSDLVPHNAMATSTSLLPPSPPPQPPATPDDEWAFGPTKKKRKAH